MKISHHLVPPGGWTFIEEKIWFSAETFDELVKMVLEYRKSNNRPIGNPVEEIENQIAEKYPSFIVAPIKIKIHGS